MDYSIAYFIEKVIPKLEKIQKDWMQHPDCLEALTQEVFCAVLDFGCSFVSDTLDQCNVMLEDSLKRRENWQIKDRCERSILTSLGMVRFQHTRFIHKQTGETAYLLDRIMGLSAHTRLSSDAKSLILEEAVQSSYEKAGKRLPEPVSKETVMRTVHSLNLSQLPETGQGEKRRVETLYVEADEDHIALQFHEKKGDVKRWKGHGDNGQIVKLVYVHEGKEDKGKRKQLKNPHFFGGIYSGKENERLWREVSGYIQKTYDMESVKQIRFQSDGGGWMKKGLEMTGGEFVLDGFHLKKYVKRLCRVLGQEEKEEEMWVWIKGNQKKKAEEWVEEKRKMSGEKESGKAEKTWKYLKRNWKGARARVKEEGTNTGSSTEGHVSQILSARMSSRPMGWSKGGADQLARLRIYWKNGGKMEDVLGGGKGEEPIQEEGQAYLSVREILNWEKRTRKRNGKYIEALQARVGSQIGAKVYFQAAIAGVC